MTDWICKEVHTDNGGYFEPVRELIRCEDCAYWCKGDGLFPTIDGVQFHACWELIGIGVKDSETLVPEFHYCSWAVRKEE